MWLFVFGFVLGAWFGFFVFAAMRISGAANTRKKTSSEELESTRGDAGQDEMANRSIEFETEGYTAPNTPR